MKWHSLFSRDNSCVYNMIWFIVGCKMIYFKNAIYIRVSHVIKNSFILFFEHFFDDGKLLQNGHAVISKACDLHVVAWLYDVMKNVFLSVTNSSSLYHIFSCFVLVDCDPIIKSLLFGSRTLKNFVCSELSQSLDLCLFLVEWVKWINISKWKAMLCFFYECKLMLN